MLAASMSRKPPRMYFAALLPLCRKRIIFGKAPGKYGDFIDYIKTSVAVPPETPKHDAAIGPVRQTPQKTCYSRVKLASSNPISSSPETADRSARLLGATIAFVALLAVFWFVARFFHLNA